MEKLLELFQFWKSEDFVDGKTLRFPISEAYLDNKGVLDLRFIQTIIKTNITKGQLVTAFKEVFGYSLPTKFHTESIVSTLTKEQFLKYYEPAEFPNAREWVTEMWFEYGLVASREEIFNWIMSTQKSKVYLGDLYD